MKYICSCSTLSGSGCVTPSKSHTLRAILLTSMVNGRSTIANYLDSPDAHAMINACRMIGANIEIVDEKQLVIEGVNGLLQCPSDVINAGNSGQVLRFMSAMLALQSKYAVITGDESIRYNRPMQPLIEGINQLGAFCVSTKGDGYAPIVIRGQLEPGVVQLDGQDSQPVSALLLAAAFVDGTTEIKVESPGEKPWIDLTLAWLKRLGVRYENHDYRRYFVYGNVTYSGFNYSVPSDFSSVLFPVAAALVTKSEITLNNIDMQDVQGDKKALAVLQKMGANIIYDADTQQLTVKKTERLIAQEIDVNDFIDAVTTFAVIGCFAEGKTIIKGAQAARGKECDRIAMIVNELRKMGADITEFTDGIEIKTSKLIGTSV
ncbi:MAG: 3-phosphoshikimate 1-carboxyvinyltransferase, partial [Gammaproteobacteria bacterium]|nr:3-phosphoshikimate 1-carboxyvinyltransferase [Gammaproteobacteria bacterium]